VAAISSRFEKEIVLLEAKNILRALLDRVEPGEKISPPRLGTPVVTLVSREEHIDREKAHAAADRIRARAKALAVEPLDWATLKDDRDEGRP